MPLALADLGYHTYVVDPDTLGGKYGNEWDFVDYGRWGIETIRAGMEDPVFEAGTLDVAVSVSVIEHLPAEARRRGLEQIYSALRPGGIAVFSVDVLPDGINLWNRVEDEVEPVSVHGTVEDFYAECEAAGFRLEERASSPVTVPELKVRAVVLTKPDAI
jgi:SAM-dependent methyltransferase